MQWPPTLGDDLLVSLFGIGNDEIGDAVHHGVRKALLNADRVLGGAAPFELSGFIFGTAPGCFSNLHQPLTGIGAAVQHHVFDPLAQHRLQFVVDPDHAGIDDAHVHAG
ncbi:hypothetical protein GALL_532850 [mine drainage metagenome]|uniref:Uncharacterized protein n=1 Tax=mine drainage metagenome TaxID=410659 RepID=A0A1J5P216_9ZZZZ